MYGTTMICKTNGSREQIEAAFDEWMREHAPKVPGFVDAGILFADDGVTIVNWARFTDKAAYQALSDSPEQDTYWQSRLAPLLEGEPQWVDGEWSPPMTLG
jgi:antibiotic biosynthesis monooxygenase (ABM) superfamily enzyme